MTIPDPRKKHEDSGHARRTVMRYSVAAGIALFLFLVVYFLLYGPLGEHPEAYPPSNRNVDVEDQAKPQPTPAP